MRYGNIKDGIFIKRPNRFIAEVEIDGKAESVHVKNTGRLKELLISGTPVLLEESDNPERKTKYSLISVYKGEEIVNIDSQAPNSAAFEALKNGKIAEIGMPDMVKREVRYGDSRFDLYYEKDGIKGFIEVKGVTLDVKGTAKFPDAPTQRGAKHVNELINARRDGYECSVLFVIQMKNISSFEPNYETDPKFSKALAKAAQNGVNVLAYDCVVGRDSMALYRSIQVRLR